MNIYSWNVLHIIHEINYANNSPILYQYPDESKRIYDIYTYLHDIIASNADNLYAICLQEVPGDLLILLHQKYRVFYYRYERVPTLKNEAIYNPYMDGYEYLVTITNVHIWTYNIIQFHNPGKAALIITFNLDNGKLMHIANIHLPYDDNTFFIKENKENNALKQIKNYFDIYDYNYILAGDMNTDESHMTNNLNRCNFSNFYLPHLNDTTYKNITGNKKIDHFIVSNAIYSLQTNVFDNNLSDHKMIGLSVLF